MSISLCEVVLPGADQEKGEGPEGWCGAVQGWRSWHCGWHSHSDWPPVIPWHQYPALQGCGGSGWHGQATQTVLRLCHEFTRD